MADRQDAHDGERPSPILDDPRSLALAAVAHDVNQMLAVISGRVGLLLRRDPDPDRRCHLQAIELACRDAATVVARLRPGTEPELGAACRLADEAAAVAALIRPPGRQAWDLPGSTTQTGPHWTFAADIAQDLGARVPGQVVREVLSNLVLNALEAMPQGGTITVGARRTDGRVCVRVTDDGPGLAPTAGRSPAGGAAHGRAGRGIGLAGCRQLLAVHGGTLSIGEGSGPGAVLVVDLPAAELALSGPSVGPSSDPLVRIRTDAAALPATGELPEGEGVRVLVVDDEPAVRDMLADVLTELGCTVTTAPDAAAALGRFSPGAFQVALLDQSLPGMAGEELAKILRAGDACLAVFLMTGWGNENVLAGYDARAVDFTARKPMEFDRLRQLLDEAADLHRRRRDGRI